MCIVSMVTDDWTRKQWPNILPFSNPPAIQITPEDFYRLKQEVEQLKKELKKARQKDVENGAPLCAHKESVDLIKDLMKRLEIDPEDIFDGHEKS